MPNRLLANHNRHKSLLGGRHAEKSVAAVLLGHANQRSEIAKREAAMVRGRAATAGRYVHVLTNLKFKQ